ncbi:MAG: hypothetical protein RIS47_2177 [Bacteroidota bacterium]
MNNLFVVCFAWLASVGTGLGQHYRLHPELQTDSSYNVAREFTKHHKKYPDIEIVKAVPSAEVLVDSNLVYRSLGERMLHLDLIRPSRYRKKRLPVVLMVHGGGWRSGDKSMQWPLAFRLAKEGFACIPIEYRLSTEAQYPASITDLKSAIAWVRTVSKQYHLDPDRVALLGCSSGGQMVSLVGSSNAAIEKFEPKELPKTDTRVKAVVDIDGVLAFIHPDSGEGIDAPTKPSAATLWFGKPTAADSSSRIEASALTYAGEQSANFLILCSSQPRFHAAYKEMIAALEAKGKHGSAYELSNTPHTFWLFQPWFEEMVGQIVPFLRKELQ